VARFVVATRRGRRGAGLAVQVAEAEPDLTLLGHSNPDRVVVEASARAIDRARRQYGDRLIFEPLIEHNFSGESR
jgi:hypothetical protein